MIQTPNPKEEDQTIEEMSLCVSGLDSHVSALLQKYLGDSKEIRRSAKPYCVQLYAQ